MFARTAVSTVRRQTSLAQKQPWATRWMSVLAGKNLAEEEFELFDEAGSPVTAGELLTGKRVVLFGVPGAFTPVCSQQHVPSYIQHLDDLKNKGVDDVVCVSVNDRFVMDAWKTDLGADGIRFLADPDASFVKKFGLSIDIGRGSTLLTRGVRFSLLVENGVVKSENIEASPGEFKSTGADTILQEIK